MRALLPFDHADYPLSLDIPSSNDLTNLIHYPTAFSDYTDFLYLYRPFYLVAIQLRPTHTYTHRYAHRPTLISTSHTTFTRNARDK